MDNRIEKLIEAAQVMQAEFARLGFMECYDLAFKIEDELIWKLKDIET